MSTTLTCWECEAQLSEYRDGTLAAPSAASVRAHLQACAACGVLGADLNAVSAALGALPQMEPPPRLLAAILVQTAVPLGVPGSAGAARPYPAYPAWSWAGMRAVLFAPRFTLGVAMSVFAVALTINAAQLDLSHVSVADFTPASLAGSVLRQASRVWARGVSYYNDLRVVYEIEAALHQLRQNAPSPPRSEGAPPPAPRTTV
jgi:hypothetical protein